MSYVISLTLAQPSFITFSVVWKLYELVHLWDPLHNNYEISVLPLIDSANLLTVCPNPTRHDFQDRVTTSLNPISIECWGLWNLSMSSILMSEHVRAQSFSDEN